MKLAELKKAMKEERTVVLRRGNWKQRVRIVALNMETDKGIRHCVEYNGVITGAIIRLHAKPSELRET